MKILSNFQAEINGMTVTNQSLYASVDWLNEVYSEMTHDNQGLSEELLKQVYDVIEWWYYKYEYANIQQLESDTYSLSEDCECLQLSCEYYNGVFDEINQTIIDYKRSNE